MVRYVEASAIVGEQFCLLLVCIRQLIGEQSNQHFIHYFIIHQGDISSDYSPNKLPNPLQKSVSPPSTHRTVIQPSRPSTSSKLAKYQTPRQPEEFVLRHQSSHQSMPPRSSLSYAEPAPAPAPIEARLVRNYNVNGKQF